MTHLERLVSRLNKNCISDIAKIYRVDTIGLNKKEIQDKLREKFSIKKKNYYLHWIYNGLMTVLALFSIYYGWTGHIAGTDTNTKLSNIENLSSETSQQKIYQDRPRIIADNFQLKDKEKIVNGILSPTISFSIRNKGKRDISYYKIRHFILSAEEKYGKLTPDEARNEYYNLKVGTMSYIKYLPTFRKDIINLSSI